MLGDIVTFEWGFNITSGDKLNQFVLGRKDSDFNEVIMYQSSGKLLTYDNRFKLEKNATPDFMIIPAKAEDETKYCLKVYTDLGEIGEKCVELKILGKCLHVFSFFSKSIPQSPQPRASNTILFKEVLRKESWLCGVTIVPTFIQ